MTTPHRIGFVGTGIMGAPMARNLTKAGFHVTAWNRTPARAEALRDAGIQVAASPPELARASEVVITMLTDTPDVLSVVEGPNGLADSMAAGTVLIDMSTIASQATRGLAERLAGRGIAMLDAPVSGGSWGAQQGTLAIMVGGDEAVAAGAAGSWQLSNLGPRMVRRDFAPGFMVRLQQKDLRLVLEAANERHVPLPVASVARQLFTTLEADGLGNAGTQAVVTAIEKLANVEAQQQG
ncbi:MAG: NAD(P)-dependent oxidoreductase [SAR202 cluster bacterium]|nr:NAD(P)-dependent oxidoreductase [SAR202 cluster bacterium]